MMSSTSRNRTRPPLGRLIHWISFKSNRLYRRILALQDPRFQTNQIARTAQLGDVRLGGDVGISANVRFSGDVEIGRYCTIDRDCIFHGGKIRVGRYSQFGADVGIYALNHAMHLVTTYNNKNLFNRRLKAYGKEGTVDIGHDVWIGYNAIILSGVTVGTGAVIGAGAIVTTDIPPYGIAVGNPAKVIRKRFSDEVIRLLLEWAWWELDAEALRPYESVFTKDLTQDTPEIRQLLTEAVQKRRGVIGEPV